MKITGTIKEENSWTINQQLHQLRVEISLWVVRMIENQEKKTKNLNMILGAHNEACLSK